MRFQRHLPALITTAASLAISATAVRAADFSFNGTFTQDDNVQLFNFTVGATSDVTLRTWSYAGGVDAAGQNVPEGGFDPILAVFDGTGALINQNDDGGSNVPADSITGAHFDTFLHIGTLTPGNYTASVMEYDNFAVGPNLSDGFTRQGQGNFTSTFGFGPGPFWDVTGHERTANWEFDILGVNSATPEPTSLSLLGVASLALLARRRRSQNP